MSSSLSDTFTAALADPVFNLADCFELDALIRDEDYDPNDPSPTPPGRFQTLQRSLNVIANWYATQLAIGKSKTAVQQKSKLISIEKKASGLLSELGLDTTSDPHEIPFDHLLPGGIFEDTNVEFEPLIRAVQAISLQANKAICKHQERGTSSTPRSPDVYFYRLCADLGSVYNDVWSHDALMVSVNDGVGGPSVRFFEYTLKRIVGKAVKPKKIEDAIRKIKSGEVDLSRVSSFFSPEGGSRI